MSRKNLTVIHLFIWLFAIFANFPHVALIKGIGFPQLVTFLFAFLYLMMAFYLFYLFIVPTFLKPGKLVLFFGISLLTIIILPFFGYCLLFFIRAVFEGSFVHFFKGYGLKMHMSGFFPVVTASVFGSFFRIMINWYDEMSRKSDSEKRRLAVELDLLKSKLNPHFLFNTLNNIDSLIRTNPEEASSSLVRLSEIMRYLTYETNSENVKLGKEMDYIRNFVELFRIRLKSPEDIRLEIDGDLNVEVSPALFIPLLENAFKYARFGKKSHGVSIKLTSKDGVITFRILNGYENERPEYARLNSGFGLANLKKRLELSYPGRHSLTLEKKEDLFQVELIIDTNENQLHSH